MSILWLYHPAGRLLTPTLAAQLRGGTIQAVLFTTVTYCGFKPLFDLCERSAVPALSYETEFPVWKTWTRIVTGGYFDHLLYLRRILPRAAGIIGISSFWAGAAQRLGIPFTLIPSYLPDELSALVSLGLWVPRECPLVLLRAIKEAYIGGIPIRYTAIGRVGSTPMERAAMRMYKRDPVLRKIVRIAGWVDEVQKEELLDSADAFVILRRQNTETAALFPTRLPEYLAHGRPVIASSSGDLSLYLQHRKSALLVPGEDDGTILHAEIIKM
jgi:glycosyltransferase involved in cell wall biosynthesis